MNSKIRFEKPLQLPCEANPTTVEVLASQTNANNQYPYWNALADGFVEGFKIPFVALFGVLGMVGCDSKGRLLIDSDVSSSVQDAQADVSNKIVDARADVTVDVKNDVAGNYDAADVSIVNDVASSPDSVSADINFQDIEVIDEVISLKDVFVQDASVVLADIPNELPQDSGVDVVDVMDAGICQYFCDAPIPDVAKDLIPSGSVYTKMCIGMTGLKTISAPKNSVAAACTNEEINSELKGQTSCVAECGFFDDKVYLSTDPDTPVPFSTSLFVPPQISKKSYTITLKLNAPILSDGTKPVFPAFMGNSFEFAFNPKLYDMVGAITWDSFDKNANGSIKGKLQIHFKPNDYFLNFPEFLDIAYTDTIGNNVAYRYPCDMLVGKDGSPNPIVQCSAAIK